MTVNVKKGVPFVNSPLTYKDLKKINYIKLALWWKLIYFKDFVIIKVQGSLIKINGN